jgi:hypothetical protein
VFDDSRFVGDKELAMVVFFALAAVPVPDGAVVSDNTCIYLGCCSMHVLQFCLNASDVSINFCNASHFVLPPRITVAMSEVVPTLAGW